MYCRKLEEKVQYIQTIVNLKVGTVASYQTFACVHPHLHVMTTAFQLEAQLFFYGGAFLSMNDIKPVNKMEDIVKAVNVDSNAEINE